MRYTYFLLSFVFFVTCTDPKTDSSPKSNPKVIHKYEDGKIKTELHVDITSKELLKLIKEDLPCELEIQLREDSLVNIQDLDSTIHVNLKYSSTDNFFHTDAYGCLTDCFLQPDVANKVVNAQKYLKKINANYSLLIYDGVRPRSVQQLMWDTLKMPFSEKIKFVSNPKNGSLHNFGAAVDITIFNLETDSVLDMGTPFDYIGELAWPTKEQKLLKTGELTEEIVYNRKLLRRVMHHAGFFNIQTEWWHFNSCRREVARKKYRIVE